MPSRTFQAGIVVVALSGAAMSGCGGGGGGGGGGSAPTPVISNINGSTAPASPVNVAIEVNGTNFGATTGTVRFQQGSAAPIDVSPTAAGAWTDVSILVTVPGGVAAPGSASVTVISAGGPQSAPVNLNLTTTPAFSPSSITWGTTTALPTPLRAHAAVAAPATASSAWIYVIGGNTGTANVPGVSVATLDRDANVGAWQATNPLPAARAFHAVALADASNSAVPSGQAFIYVIGGQQSSTDAPGGTSTIFVGSVSLGDGAVTWTTSSVALPEARVGCKAVVAGGSLHVVGGLNTSGGAISQTVSASIGSNGSLGAFTGSSPSSDLPTPVAFHETFAFGGFIYVIDGDSGPQTAPFGASSALATNNSWIAPIRQGVVGTWQASGKPIKAREKFALFSAFGQVLVYEGLSPSTKEGERSQINPDGSLGSFNGLTGGSNPNLNTFNQATVTSPLLSSTNSPRFLLLGGDSATSPGTLSANVSRTTAP